ncbi:hypothetical protein AwDysgo_11250 [Bacteroidales bacterium]|nr:hypothetical protein AwDysgo_11250 [Bacteroidales bacterium]
MIKKNDGIIFMLHRVATFDKEGLLPNENMKVSPEFLCQLILKYKKRGVFFASLDDVYLHQTKVKKIPCPFVCFTLDDGYLDNYEIAYPIFKEHNVPFAIYLTSGFPNHTAILWWYIIEELILKHKKIQLSSGEILDCLDKEAKTQSFLRLRHKIISFGAQDLASKLRILLSNYELDLYSKVKELSMSWDQVKQISQDSLCTIGGHSVNHPAFNTLTKEQMSFEVRQNKQEIEDYTKKDVSHFAYPYGSKYEVGEREFEMMKDFGFDTITLAYGGGISKKNNRFTALPRLFLENSL